MASSPEIRRFVVISTGHVSPETAAHLESTPSLDWPTIGGRYSEYGWFMYASDINDMPGDLAIPDDLFAVMTWARSQGVEHILFDRDADAIDGLPWFDW
jgi:hypothetical protein